MNLREKFWTWATESTVRFLTVAIVFDTLLAALDNRIERNTHA